MGYYESYAASCKSQSGRGSIHHRPHAVCYLQVATGRKLIALLCLAAIIIAALNTASSALPWAILVPLWLCLGLLIAVTHDREREASDAQPLCLLCVVRSRDPPDYRIA